MNENRAWSLGTTTTASAHWRQLALACLPLAIVCTSFSITRLLIFLHPSADYYWISTGALSPSPFTLDILHDKRSEFIFISPFSLSNAFFMLVVSIYLIFWPFIQVPCLRLQLQDRPPQKKGNRFCCLSLGVDLLPNALGFAPLRILHFTIFFSFYFVFAIMATPLQVSAPRRSNLSFFQFFPIVDLLANQFTKERQWECCVLIPLRMAGVPIPLLKSSRSDTAWCLLSLARQCRVSAQVGPNGLVRNMAASGRGSC